MNLKTGILLILFGVLLAAVVVGQRLQTRSVAFEAGAAERELRLVQKQNLVLRVERARKSDPTEMMRRVREAGIPLLPPEVKEAPPAQVEKPGKSR
ncbi:MAG: hypothetical protein KF754_04490 [Planctomycetes bacterium]|nr:hypothetical protein [Planctomycetota bacterium]